MTVKKTKTKMVEAGKASKPTSSNVLSRAAVINLLSEDDLKKRQEKIGKKRRSSGPPLQKDKLATITDAPETKC